MGFDISDFTDVDPLFGTMKDFDELISEMKRRGWLFMNVKKKIMLNTFLSVLFRSNK